MPIWSRVGQGAWAAVKGGRRLQDAADRAEAEGDGPRPAVAAVATPVGWQEGLLLARFLAARGLLGWLEVVFLFKYVLLALGLLGWFLGDSPPVLVLGAALFVVLAAAQWLVTRVIERVGACDELADLDRVIEEAPVVWWPNLRRELRRVGLSDRPTGLLRLGAGAAVRRLPDTDKVKLEQIDWLAVAPRDQWHTARRALSEAAARRG